MGWCGRLLGVGAALGVGIAAGAWVEARAFVVREAHLPVLPAGQDELRVLHFSDIHLMSYQERKQSFVAGLVDLHPDLVIGTGDYISSAGSVDLVADLLSGLRGIPGGFVFGSNDFSKPVPRNPFSYLAGNSTPQKHPRPLPWQRLQERLSEGGWLFLDNRSGRVEADGRIVELRGTADAHTGLDEYHLVAGPRAADADLSIGVTHAPYRRVLDAMADDGLDLVLAGHTHGGQVCLPVNRALVNNSDIPLEYTSGLNTWHHGEHSVPLHVSAGIGTSPFVPLRLFCRPEVTLLHLTARA